MIIGGVVNWNERCNTCKNQRLHIEDTPTGEVLICFCSDPVGKLFIDFKGQNECTKYENEKGGAK